MTSEETHAFALSALESVYDLAPLKVSSSVAVKSMIDEINGLLELNASEVAKRRHQHFSIPGAIESDYSEKYYSLPNGKKFLAGIRHLSGSKEHPFVHTLLSFLPDQEDILSLKSFASLNFKVFNPRHLSFSTKSSAKILSDSGTSLTCARNYVAGLVSEIKLKPFPAACDKIELQKLDTDFDFSWYENAYKEFHSANPLLKMWVPLTDHDELKSCAVDGLLFEVTVDKKKAGLVAGKKESFLGLPAVYMTELLLVPPYKGKGLAPALQRKFIEAFSDDLQAIWGTIDAKNESSTKTAIKTGRVAIRSEYFTPLT